MKRKRDDLFILGVEELDPEASSAFAKPEPDEEPQAGFAATPEFARAPEPVVSRAWPRLPGVLVALAALALSIAVLTPFGEERRPDPPMAKLPPPQAAVVEPPALRRRPGFQAPIREQRRHLGPSRSQGPRDARGEERLQRETTRPAPSAELLGEPASTPVESPQPSASPTPSPTPPPAGSEMSRRPEFSFER